MLPCRLLLQNALNPSLIAFTDNGGYGSPVVDPPEEMYARVRRGKYRAQIDEDVRVRCA
jgi:hypothetical protein